MVKVEDSWMQIMMESVIMQVIVLGMERAEDSWMQIMMESVIMQVIVLGMEKETVFEMAWGEANATGVR